MIGYKTSEFKIALGLLAACLTVYFFTDQHDIWALIVTSIACAFLVARTLTKKHRAIYEKSKLTELIVTGIAWTILSLPLYQGNIESIFWLGCVSTVGIFYLISRGNSKALPIQHTTLIHR